MSDTIDRQATIDAIDSLYFDTVDDYDRTKERIKRLPSAQPEITLESAIDYLQSIGWMQEHDRILSSAQQEKTEFIPDTKAVPSTRDCVDLNERVTATYYDEQHEEWTQKTVTIADVLNCVCDDYTVLPAAQPERKQGKWIDVNDGKWNTIEVLKCSVCGEMDNRMNKTDNFCPNCGAYMNCSNEDNKWVSEIHDRLMDETGDKAVRKNEHWGRGDNNEIN